MTKEVLENLYCNELKTDAEIGMMFGITGEGVSYYRKKYGIGRIHSRDRISRRANRSITEESLEDFQSLYQKMGVRGMAEIFGCSTQLIKTRLCELGLNSLSKTDRVMLKCQDLTSFQKDMVYGSLLGDGHIQQVKGTSRYKESHCLDQKPYLEWKHDVLRPLSLRITEDNKEMASGLVTRGFSFRTHFHPCFNEFRNLFYRPEKILPEDFEERVNPFILAIWYMDDGSLDGFEKKGYVTISSSFSTEAIERVLSILNYKYSLSVTYSHVCNQTKGLNIIRIHDTDKFFNLTENFILPCMRYKIPLRLGGVKKEVLGEKDIEAWFKFFREYGMIKPYLAQDVFQADMKALASSDIAENENILECSSVAGSKTCLSVFKNIYLAKRKGRKSAQEIFDSDDGLRHVLSDCVKYYGKITEAKVITELNSFGGVNNFKPVLAKWIINTYCPKGGCVLDPCSGYGGRLCGFMSSHAFSYTGIDAEEENYENLKKLFKKLDSVFPSKYFVNYHSDFLEWDTDKKYDLVFTSPPYCDAEIYGTDKNQSIIKYGNSYSEWMDMFLLPLIHKSISLLNPNGRIILNLPFRKYPFVEDVQKVCPFTVLKILNRGRYGGQPSYEALMISEKRGMANV